MEPLRERVKHILIDMALGLDTGEPRDVCESARDAILAAVEEDRAATFATAYGENLGLKERAEKAEAREAALREALETVRDYLLDIPGGPDMDANPLDTSPDDMTAHLSGLSVNIIDAILARGRE